MKSKEYLKSFFTEHWKYMTVNAACKLGLFDVLSVEGKTLQQVSNLLNVPENNIDLLLKGLLNINFLDIIEDKYVLNNLSVLLTENHPESLKYACMNWSDDHLEAWNDLDQSIKSGKSFFENKHKMNYFDFLNQDEAKLENYHKAMFAYAKDDYKHIADVFDFSVHNSLMDVGGGYGACISIIKKENPGVKCYLFDLELVIEKSMASKDVNLVAGDFFVSVPKLSEAILLSRVLHDWDDEKASQIINNVYRALPENGNLYIIENLTDTIKDEAALLSLNMHVITKSFERNLTAYNTLLSKGGFTILEIKKINDLQHLIVAKKDEK
ncbi:O-methyltransferase [Oceanihabitans sediminis]|uniref:Methyltransferase n=1 Tax=Oceanihabitans sediminis TaxID=1812012 RepID=A0A368P3W6_9FLAO|nr:methyltransferase [Oceanihabitans sediminis]RBP28397.1 O-methyltransferase [Oceanihabitans sediminis]RCU56595.1 methyltransferase [Oceanihabitans sediminis]